MLTEVCQVMYVFYTVKYTRYLYLEGIALQYERDVSSLSFRPEKQ